MDRHHHHRARYGTAAGTGFPDLQRVTGITIDLHCDYGECCSGVRLVGIYGI